ncbi:Wzz/FepE/Etk N-terminal domain-containing protein [Streptomyces filamentosus]|uniref:Wzz/FepE/Etk N-terminal domain-containing protein n=1 Tax=Streptomyces filamentosus TaxID=67294 RepID=UPI0037CFFE0B
MSDDTIRLVTIGRIVRRRRRFLTLLVLLGALTGYGASLLFPPRYTTTASVLLPGAWEERELLTQAQVATSSVVVDEVAAALDWPGVDGVELREHVTAKAADGNVIALSGTADTPERAQRLADLMAGRFVAFATQVIGDGTDPEAAARLEALRKTVAQTGRRITELAEATGPGRSVESVQTRTELEGLRTALQESVDKLEQAGPTSDKAKMVVMGPAVRPAGEAPPTRIQLVAAGALLFFLVAVLGHLTAARMSRRLRTGPEIATALDSVLLGGVDVPEKGAAHRPGGRGPRALLRRLVGLDVRWDVPPPRTSGGEADRLVRHRRVHARLRDLRPAPRRLLVLVPGGDDVAGRAAAELVSGADGDPLLRAVEVSVDEPMVPDRAGESGALVVVSAGRLTAAELAGLSGACADAGHELVGVVLAGTVRIRPGRPPGRAAAGPGEIAAQPVAVGGDATGGAR